MRLATIYFSDQSDGVWWYGGVLYCPKNRECSPVKIRFVEQVNTLQSWLKNDVH